MTKKTSAFGMKIEIDTFIENNAKTGPHVLMIMISTSCLFIYYYTLASKKCGGYTVIALSVLPSVLLFVTSNASQPLQTWYYCSSTRGRTRRLPN